MFTVTEVKLAEFLHTKPSKASEVCQDVLDQALGDLQSLGELPVYTPETEDDFLKSMLQSDLNKKVTQVATNIEDGLSSAENIASRMSMDMDIFLPKQASMRETLKTLLQTMSTTTCLRILKSKAATSASNSATLRPNVEQTLDFISKGGMDVPADVLGRMNDLLKRLPDNGGADPNSVKPKPKRAKHA